MQVGFCHITSPIDGRVGLRLVDPGNLVTANSTTTLVVVAQIQPITVIFTLAEDSLPQVLEQMRGGKALEVDAYDRTQQKLLAKGKLITIDNQIDTVTGTVKLRAQFDNCERHALSQSVREYAPAGEDARQPDSGSLFGDPAQRLHRFCLSHPKQ